MKFRDLIKSPNVKNLPDEPDWSELFEEYELYNSDYWFDSSIDEYKLKSYWIKRWYCTDRYVGMKIYFLEDKPIMVSYQGGRKSSITFTLLDAEYNYFLYEYLLSLKKQQDDIPSLGVVESLDEELVDRYQLDYPSEILNKQGYYNGELVDIIERPNMIDGKTNFSDVIVKRNGYNIKVDIKDLTFDYFT